MIKQIFLFLFLLQFHSIFAQKSLEQVVQEIQNDPANSSTYGYSDQAGNLKGISIQNEPQILEILKLEPLEYGEYHLTGKYEINQMIILFVSNFWETEDIHFALLLDSSFNLIDRLDETAYDNADGFYRSYTYIDYNIVRTTTYNAYRKPIYVNKKYTITDDGFKPIRDEVIVSVPSGCRVYEEPTSNSVTRTWANHAEIFDYISDEYDSDPSNRITGEVQYASWFEVAQNNSFDRFGYIIADSAKRNIRFSTNDYDVRVTELSKEDFQAEEINKASKPVVEKITDIDEILGRLGNQLILEHNHEYGYDLIKSITADNGKEIKLYWYEYGVTAYFPEYHYLLLEGGHSTECIIDLCNGDEDIDRIGNPDYYLPSPDGSFRLNGYYSGQSFEHFLEKLTENGETEYLFSISSLIMLDFIETYFWKDDATLFLKIENEFFSVRLKAK